MYRNGPGRFEGAHAVFDGVAMVARFKWAGGAGVIVRTCARSFVPRPPPPRPPTPHTCAAPSPPPPPRVTPSPTPHPSTHATPTAPLPPGWMAPPTQSSPPIGSWTQPTHRLCKSRVGVACFRACMLVGVCVSTGGGAGARAKTAPASALPPRPRPPLLPLVHARPPSRPSWPPPHTHTHAGTIRWKLSHSPGRTTVGGLAYAGARGSMKLGARRRLLPQQLPPPHTNTPLPP